MSYSFEQLENSMVKIRMEVPRDKFEAAINKVYNKQKGSIQVPGFRKGKAPRALIEKTYGKEVFYEDAVNEVLPEVYEEAVNELKLDIMSRPEIDLDPITADAPVVIYAVAAVKPEVKLGKFRAMKVAKAEVTVSDEEVEEELKKQQEKQARLIDSDDAAELGDTANIDYEGSIDGIPFDGGKDNGFDLKLGSHSFIDGFEDQLVGAKKGDDVDVKVSFPEEYHAKELAGKPALFKCHVNAVKKTELPELNDDFAQDVSDCDTLDAYKEQLKADLAARKEKANEESRNREIMDKMIEKATIELPQCIIDTRADMMIEDMEQNMRYQGFSLQQYLQMTGSTYASFKQTMLPEAERRVKEDLILEQVAADEKLEVSDEEYETELKETAEMYNMELDKLKSLISEGEAESVKKGLLKKKAKELLAEAVKA